MYRILFLILLLLLAGCAPGAATLAPTIDLGQPAPTEMQYAPQETAYPGPCLYPVEGALCPSTAPKPEAYPAPGAGAGLLEQLTPAPVTVGAAPAVSPFQDCARTPGLTGCDLAPPPLAGRLAFYEAASARLIFLDLENGAGAQTTLEGAPRALDWSADGATLLADLGADTYALYDASGQRLETFQSETLPRWQPDGSLSRDGTVRSADGWQAALSSPDGMAWELRVQSPAGEQASLPLSGLAPSPDALFSLRGWVPGQPVLLLQTYTAGNAAMLGGAQLAFLDMTNGAFAPVEVSAPLEDAAFAWDPAQPQPPRLAFLKGGGPEGGRGLALLNFTGLDQQRPADMLAYPLPEGVLVGDLAWRPDGQRLAFSVTGLAENASEAARAAFPAPGIYQLDPATGTLETLVQTPPAAQDGWLHWSAGVGLIYARALPGTAGAGSMQVRARQVETGQEWVLVDGLPVDETVAGQVVWRRLAAFAPR